MSVSNAKPSNQRNKKYKKHGAREQKKMKQTFKCEKCDQLTVSKKALRDHMERPHIQCEICSALTTQPVRHKRKFHNTRVLIRIKKPKLEISNSKSKPKRKKKSTFKCISCDYEAKDIKWLTNHINKIHKQDELLVCSKCDYTTASKESYDMHNRTPHDKCEVCSLVATHYMLLRHKRKLGHGLKVLNCGTCNFKTTEKRNMDRHITIVHVKDKYKCDKCDYATSVKASYYAHKKKDHLTCEICQFVTTNDRLLKRHKVSWHSSCNLQTESNLSTQNEVAEITKSFQESKSSLSEHDQSETNTAYNCKEESLENKVAEFKDGVYWTPFIGLFKDELKPDEVKDDYWTFQENTLSCSDCNFVGSSESDISQHKANHHKKNTEVQCEKCPYISKSKGGLTHHMGVMHLHRPKLKKAPTQKEKIYKCNLCDYTTNHSISFRKHKSDHITSPWGIIATESCI